MSIISCTKPESTFFLPFFIGLSVICPQSVFYVFGVIEIQRNRFQRVVMHVSIVIERRNVVRWKSTPASRRNKRRRSQVTIFLQVSTFFENLCGKPFTIINARVKLMVIPTLDAIPHTFHELVAFFALFQAPAL